MHDFVGYLRIKEIRQLVIALLPRLVDSEPDGIDPFRLEGAILHRQTSSQILDLADDPILEIHDRKFTEPAAPFLEQLTEDQGVARLVGTLTGQEHSQLPRRIREVG